MTDERLAELLGWHHMADADEDGLVHRIRLIVAEAQAEGQAMEADHIYRLRERIGRDTDAIYTLRGLLTLARDALADCLDDAPTADQLSVSGGVYEGVAAKTAIRAIDEALEQTQ